MNAIQFDRETQKKYVRISCNLQEQKKLKLKNKLYK